MEEKCFFCDCSSFCYACDQSETGFRSLDFICIQTSKSAPGEADSNYINDDTHNFDSFRMWLIPCLLEDKQEFLLARRNTAPFSQNRNTWPITISRAKRLGNIVAERKWLHSIIFYGNT
jgi:hypothetical protein